MTKPPPGSGRESEGWESLSEEASEGVLTPNEELERALREATEAVEARESARVPRSAPRVPDPAAESESNELEALRAELQEKQDRLLRLQADFENFRRRTLKEREEAYQYGHQNLVKDLLPTVDNLERAIGHARKSGHEDLDGLLQGIDLVQRELMGVLAKHGVTEIGALGQAFDPSVHEALAQVEDPTVPANTVVQVFQKGYRLRDRMLRPAQVVVSRTPSEKGVEREA
ncbi:MAG TPA: nucleotide exchange factor GrpE [Myxococcota bacterium]|nr:nucleotide exchange factor GrpE [Myxococcota bacterium]